jgi:hypothetical protein
MKKQIALFGIIFLLLALNTEVAAQCAMCKSTAISDHDSGSTNAESLNTGILYLMTIPYLIIMVGGYFFFRKSIAARILAFRKRFSRSGE